MPMTRLQAQLAVDRNPRLRGLGRNREEAILQVMRMEPEEIVSRLPAGSPLVRNPTRQRVVSAAMGGPDEGAPPAPPASPAAVRASVPPMSVLPQVAAPAPAAAPAQPAPSKFISPARARAAEAEREMKLINGVVEDLAKQGQAAPPEARIRLERAQQRFASAIAEADAEEAAQIDPNRAAILARQEGQIKEEEARIAGDVKRSPWEALTQGGLALMDPEPGAGFISALSSGLRTGLSAYTSAKADAIERRARLQKESDSADLQRLDYLARARADAVAAIRRGEEVDERTARMAKMTNEEIADASLRPFAIQRAKADASLAETRAQYEPQVIQSDITYKGKMGDAAGVRASNTGDGGSGGPKPVTATANSDIKGLEKAENDAVKLMTDARRAWVAAGKPGSGEEVTSMRDANTALQAAMAARKGYLERLGLPYTEKNIPAKKAYRQEFGLEPKPGSRPAARPSGPPRPADVGPDWTLKEDANGRKAWVSPDGKRFKEVR